MTDPRTRGSRTTLRITLDAEVVEGESSGYSGDAAVLARAQAFVATLGQGRVTSAIVLRGTDRALVVLDEVTASYEDVAELCEPDDAVKTYKFV